MEVYADSTYGSSDTRVEIRSRGHDAVITPIPLRRAIPGGFNRHDFIIDHHARTATCPAGHTVTITTAGNATFGTRCTHCPLRQRCTTAKDGKGLVIRPHDEELVYGRTARRDPILQDHYRRHRPMVERTIAWVARGHRKVRYRGVARNQISLAHRAAAVNLQRLVNLGLVTDGSRRPPATQPRGDP